MLTDLFSRKTIRTFFPLLSPKPQVFHTSDFSSHSIALIVQFFFLLSLADFIHKKKDKATTKKKCSPTLECLDGDSREWWLLASWRQDHRHEDNWNSSVIKFPFSWKIGPFWDGESNEFSYLWLIFDIKVPMMLDVWQMLMMHRGCDKLNLHSTIRFKRGITGFKIFFHFIKNHFFTPFRWKITLHKQLCSLSEHIFFSKYHTLSLVLNNYVKK